MNEDIVLALEALPASVDSRPHLQRIGRYCSTEFMLEAGEMSFHILVDRGRVTRVLTGPRRMRAWVFAKLLWDPGRDVWPLMADGETWGELRSIAWSPGLGAFIGLAVVLLEYAEPGTRLQAEVPGASCRCRVEALPLR